MNWNPPSHSSTVVFIFICCFNLFVGAWGLYQGLRRSSMSARGGRAASAKLLPGALPFQSPGKVVFRAGMWVLAWLAGLSAVVVSGVLETNPMLGLPLFFGAIFLGVGLGFRSRWSRVWADGLPLWALVGAQGFRLPLEWVLHSWVEQGTIPQSMTWTGNNWDIVSGVICLAVALVLGFARTRTQGNRRDRLPERLVGLAWAANGVGAVLLVNVMRVAVLSSPVSFGWGVQPPLQLAFHLPFAWIGPLCVGAALFGHLCLTRRLMSGRPSTMF